MPLRPEKQLHILFLSSWYPSGKNQELGIFVRRHALAAASLHKVTVLHALSDEAMKEGEFRLEKKEQGDLKELIIYYGKSVSRFTFFRKIRNLNLLKSHYQFGLKKLIEWAGKPDLIHANIPYPVGLIARSFSRSLGIPYVVTEHWTGYQPEDGRYQSDRQAKFVTRKSIRGAASIMPVSEQLGAVMQKLGLSGNYTVISNVVDTNLFTPAENAPGVFRLIHVSSMDNHQKNVTGLIEAFGEARKIDHSLELVIVGSGNDEAAIRRFSNELGLTTRGIVFLGAKRDEELAEAFRSSSALIMNSRFENQPVVVLEALSSGIPVISTNVGGISEHVNEERGILIPQEPNQLTSAILKMKEGYAIYNKQEIRRYAVEHFSASVIAEQLNALYRSVLGHA